MQVDRGLVESTQCIMHFFRVYNFALVSSVMVVDGNVKDHHLDEEISNHPEDGLFQNVENDIIPGLNQHWVMNLSAIYFQHRVRVYQLIKLAGDQIRTLAKPTDWNEA